MRSPLFTLDIATGKVTPHLDTILHVTFGALRASNVAGWMPGGDVALERFTFDESADLEDDFDPDDPPDLRACIGGSRRRELVAVLRHETTGQRLTVEMIAEPLTGEWILRAARTGAVADTDRNPDT